jgi:2-dehydro-3-deoxygalactonokinase
MRGEETLALGAIASGLLAPGGRLLTAGSHWKLTWTDAQGRVAGSRTSLGGETLHAWQSATLLKASLPEGPLEACAPGWLAAGAAAARAEGLLRAAFQVRLLDQAGAASPNERFTWIAGACIAHDVDALFGSGRLRTGDQVLVSGPAAMPEAWADLLREAGCTPCVLPAEAAEQAYLAGLAAVLAARESSAPVLR